MGKLSEMKILEYMQGRELKTSKELREGVLEKKGVK